MTQTGWLTDPRYAAGLDELARLDRADAVQFAARVRVLSGLAARTSRDGWQGDAPFDSLVLDVAGTCHLGQMAAGSRLSDAEHLVVRLTDALEALEQGELRVPQAQVLIEQTRDLSPEVCAEVQRRVLPHAGLLCPADLRRLLKRTVLEVDAEAVARREVEARRARRSWVRPAPDGMALLCALLPAEQAQAALLGLTEQARQARREGDGRTVDQLRADLLVGPWLDPDTAGDVAAPAAGRARHRRRAGRRVRVVVHVPLAVAQGVSDAPADLEGYGPISASHARRLLLEAELQRACVDPGTGQVWALDEDAVRTGSTSDPAAAAAAALDTADENVDEGWLDLCRELDGRPRLDAALRELAERPPPRPLPPEPRHDPSAALSRLVRARDARCDGPGCSVPAARCELDHDTPWPVGDTSAANLVTRSQRCHHAKHSGWTAERGVVGTTWTSPGGRRYLVPARRGLSVVTGSPGAHRRAQRVEALRGGGWQWLSLRGLLPARGLSLVAARDVADHRTASGVEDAAPPPTGASSHDRRVADDAEPPF